MVIDTHRHAYGERTRQKFVERGMVRPEAGFPQIRDQDVFLYESYWDTDASLALQREGGVSKAILSGGSQVESLSRRVFQMDVVEVMRILFEDRMSLIERYPDDFATMVDVHPFDDRGLKVLEPALRQGAKAISVATSFGQGSERRFLDDPAAEWLWDFAEKHGAVVHCHPPFVPFGAEMLSGMRLLEAVGRPFDTALSFSRLILSGVFDRHPNLQMVAVHLGGALASVLGRLEFNWRLNYHGIADPPPEKVLKNERSPYSYLRTNLYTDVMGFSPTGVRQAVELYGSDRIFFGTDYGPLPFSPAEHIEIVRSAVPDPEDQEKIFWKNADRIFGLGLASS